MPQLPPGTGISEEAARGLIVGVNGGSQVVVDSGSAQDNWALCAKETTAGDTTGLATGVWRSMLTTAVVPKANLVNPNIGYVGNGRFQNNLNAAALFSGFLLGVPYVNNLGIISVDIAVGLWDGADIVPDEGQAGLWTGIRSPNVAKSSGDAQVYEYELVVPAGAIFGFAVRRVEATNSNLVMRGLSHTARVVV